MIRLSSIFDCSFLKLLIALLLFDIVWKGESRDLLQNEELFTNVSSVSELIERLEGDASGQAFFLDVEDLALEQPIFLNMSNVTLRGRGTSQTTLTCSDQGPGSVLVIGASGIRIEHLTIRNCKRNSAVMISATDSSEQTAFDILFSSVRFQDNGSNTTTLRGAAIRMEACLDADCVPPNIRIQNCTFSRNQATSGGSIFASGCNLAVSDSVFELNEALVGGAIFISEGRPRLDVRNSRFENNSAVVVYNLDSITESTISYQTLGLGGAITAWDLSSVVIRRGIFRYNSGYGGGGALAVRARAPSESTTSSFKFIVAHCLFEGNAAFNTSSENFRYFTLVTNNYASSGGAVLYFSEGNMDLNWRIRNSTLSNNLAYAAGALYIFSSGRSLIHRIFNSDFTDNRVRGAGGAIFTLECGVEIYGTRFYRNFGLHGGGLNVAVRSDAIFRPSLNNNRKTVFYENEAFMGGGVLVAMEARVQFIDANFTNNVAYDRGGAIASYSNSEATSVVGGSFEGNRAVAGGAIAFLTGGNLSVASHLGVHASFVGNTALVGGALHFREGHMIVVAITLEDAVFRMNQALNDDDPRVPNIDGLANRILRGDFLLADAVVENQNDDGESIYAERVRIPHGSGGAIALSLDSVRPFTTGEIFFRNLTIERNEAIIGGLSLNAGICFSLDIGGVAVFMMHRNSWNAQPSGRCLSTTFSVHDCQRFVVQNVRITKNIAQFGGGLFVTHPRSVDLLCLSNSSSIRRSLYDVMSRGMSQNRNSNATQDLSCGEISDNEIMVRIMMFAVTNNVFQGKETREGADVGTKAVSLTFDHPDDMLQETVSGEQLNLECDDEENGSCHRIVRIEVKDAFNQTIHGGTEDSSTLQNASERATNCLGLTIALSSPHILGDRRYTARNGVAEINNTFAFGINVSCELVISGVDRRNVEMNASFSIRGCNPGEYTQNNYCLRCPPRQYGFEGSRARCQTCDVHAVCDGGAALVPEDGYWHSNPFSPYFRRCLITSGCEYENRRKALTSFYNYTTKLQEDLESLDQYIAGNGPLPDFPSYKQCADGYEGVLCGSCSPDYGHSFTGECKECPDEDVTARLFLTLSFIWTVIVIGINCAMTLHSTAARTQLVFEDIKEAALARRPKTLPRTNAMSTSRRDASPETERQRTSARSMGSVEDTPDGVRDVLLATVQLTETLKILVNYLQVTSAAVHLQTEWGPGVESLLAVEGMSCAFSSLVTCSVANLVGFMSVPFVSPLECNFDDNYSTPRSIIALWARCLAPSAAMLFLIFSLVIQRKVVRPWIRRTKAGSGQTAGVNNASGTQSGSYSVLTGAIVIIIVSIYFSYINVVSQLLRSVNCIEVDHDFDNDGHPYGQYALNNEDRVWAEDTSLRCFKGKHLPTGIAGSVGLGFSVFVILLVFIWLPLNKHRLRQSSFVARYWFIYQAYRREWYSTSWEAVILIRKTLVTAVIVFSVQLGPTLQAPLCMGLLILAYSAQTFCQPFRDDQHKEFVPEYSGSFLRLFGADKWVPLWIKFNNSVSLNALESYSLVSSISVFFSVIIFGAPGTVQSGRMAMALITVLFNLSFLIYMLYRLYGGFHVLLDYKLEVLDTPFMASYPNGPGLVSAATKMYHIAKSNSPSTP